MKKLVMRVDLGDDKAKHKAMKIVSSLQGIDSIVVDMKGKKMTVIGTVDPVRLVSKLRKYWRVDIITVGPEKKEEAKAAVEGKKEEGKEEGKKEDGKGEEKNEKGKKGDGGGKKEEGGDKKDNEAGEEALSKKPQPIPEHLLDLVRARQYNPYMGNYPPYMATMANPYMSQSHPQPSYYVQRVVEEDNPNGCSIF